MSAHDGPVTGPWSSSDKLKVERLYWILAAGRGGSASLALVCIIRAFQDHPKSYVEWAITQIPPVSRTT